MKRLILCLTALLLLFIGKVNAQSDSLILQSEMKREKFRLAIVESNGLDNEFKQTILKKDQLQFLLSEKQFHNYRTAKNCYVASIPLLTISAPGIVMTTFFLVNATIYGCKYGWGRDPVTGHSAMTGIWFASVSLGGTLCTLIPGIVLHVYGRTQLNKIVVEYNTSHHLSNKRSLKVSLGFVDTGVGIKIHF